MDPCLTDLLEDEELMEALLNQPADSLSIDQAENLRELCNHFCRKPNVGKASKEGNSSASSKTWKTILGIRKLRLPQGVAEHIRQHGTKVQPFLEGHHPVSNMIGQFGKDSAGDAFIASYRYTVALESRIETDKIRWCFSMLMFFDLTRLIRPPKKEEARAQWGHKMATPMKSFLGNLVKDLDIKEVQAKLNKWSKMGRRIDGFCQVFGVGCIFFLAEYLSPDVLERKMTDTGEKRDKAIEHLKKLGLKDLSQNADADVLAKHLRTELIQPFKDAQAAQLLTNRP